jgi:hypothetical protein
MASDSPSDPKSTVFEEHTSNVVAVHAANPGYRS